LSAAIFHFESSHVVVSACHAIGASKGLQPERSRRCGRAKKSSRVVNPMRKASEFAK
jgi:hypothetical protein